MLAHILSPHSQWRSWAPIILFLLAGYPETAATQQLATLRIEENLRAEPQGVVLGRIPVGTALAVVETGEQWVRVEVQGWMWTPSLQATDRLGFDLRVSASPEENLRADPSGAIIGRLLEGTLLERLEGVPGWTRVRRVAWIWANSVTLSESGGVPSSLPTPDPSPTGAGERWWRPGPGGAPLLSGPDGDTLAHARSGVELQVMARDGNWVRVRTEGWVWAPLGEQSDSLMGAPLLELTAEQVAAAPEAYRGRVVVWELQFVSLERADRMRTDFYEGEPFLLTRGLQPGSSFVYVAVPEERVAEVEGLIPLERIRVEGRIRAGAAAFTGNPILDLVELTRISRD
jgi:hypothetical protein